MVENNSYTGAKILLSMLRLEVMISARPDTYNPVDETLIPTGIEPVEGTPMDLRKPVVVGADIDNPFTQLVYGGGYDHNWILNAAGGDNCCE